MSESILDPIIYSNEELKELLHDLETTQNLIYLAVTGTASFLRRDLNSTDLTYKVANERIRTDVSVKINKLLDNLESYFDDLGDPDTNPDNM